MFTGRFLYARRKLCGGVWLRHGLRIGLMALFALGLLAGTALATVNIHGKGLAQIDDIMAEMNHGTRAYSKNSSEQDTKDYVYETRNFTEQGWSMNFSLSGGHTFTGGGPEAVKPGMKDLIKVLTDKPPFSFSINVGVGHSVVDSTAEVSSKANSSASSRSLTMSSSTGTADSILSLETDMYLWRYPIEGQIPAWLTEQLFPSISSRARARTTT